MGDGDGNGDASSSSSLVFRFVEVDLDFGTEGERDGAGEGEGEGVALSSFPAAFSEGCLDSLGEEAASPSSARAFLEAGLVILGGGDGVGEAVASSSSTGFFGDDLVCLDDFLGGGGETEGVGEAVASSSSSAVAVAVVGTAASSLPRIGTSTSAPSSPSDSEGDSVSSSSSSRAAGAGFDEPPACFPCWPSLVDEDAAAAATFGLAAPRRAGVSLRPESVVSSLYVVVVSRFFSREDAIVPYDLYAATAGAGGTDDKAELRCRVGAFGGGAVDRCGKGLLLCR